MTEEYLKDKYYTTYRKDYVSSVIYKIKDDIKQDNLNGF